MSESSAEPAAEPDPESVDAEGFGPEDVLGNPSPSEPTKDDSAETEPAEDEPAG